jgi:hypothetical protein
MSDQSIAAPTEFRKPTNARFIDMTGFRQPSGRLTVISFHGTNDNHQALWLCECSCGNTCVILGKSIRTEQTRSCGCLHKGQLIERCTTHGDSHARLYNIYNSMIGRCLNPKIRQYKDYGGRGIAVCDEWLSNYEAFREWAHSHGYADDLTIERKDVNGHYCPENCCWIPKALQGRNRRDHRLLTAFGETKSAIEWADDPRCAVGYTTLMGRLYAWDVEQAITTPPTY